MTTSSLMQEKPGRRHDIDALRVLAFALLIAYHLGMFYVAGWHWHVKSEYTAAWLQPVMLLVNQWRLPLLFLISGVVVHFVLDRHGPGHFARLRTKRLLVPLLFGMLVVVPPQAYVQALSNGAFDGSYPAFLARYFTFSGWPDGAFDGSEIGVTWNHLWFLIYLLAYTLLLALALPVLKSGPGRRLTTAFRSMRGPVLIVTPVLPFIVYAWILGDRFPETHAFFDDPRAHLVYGTVFLFGFFIGRDEALWREIGQLRWVAVGLAVCSYTAVIAVHAGRLDLPGPAAAALGCFNSWFWLLAVLGWGHLLLNRRFGWLGYANEALYPWYVLHQTIIVVLGYYLSQAALGPVVEPLLVLAGTVGGCFVLHEFVIRRLSWLRPLFGLKAAAGPAPRRAFHRPVAGCGSRGRTEAADLDSPASARASRQESRAGQVGRAAPGGAGRAAEHADP